MQVGAGQSFAKRRMQKFNGLRSDKFYLHLKECEFRFNNRRDHLYHFVLDKTKTFPKLSIIVVLTTLDPIYLEASTILLARYL